MVQERLHDGAADEAAPARASSTMGGFVGMSMTWSAIDAQQAQRQLVGEPAEVLGIARSMPEHRSCRGRPDRAGPTREDGRGPGLTVR